MPPVIVRFRQGITLPQRAYLDTNFIIYARDRASVRYHSASGCLAELIRQGTELNVSALMFDELWWQYFKKSYNLATGKDLTPQEFKKDSTIWRTNWPRIRQITDEIRRWARVNELPYPVSLVGQAAVLIDTNPLAPRDAFHLALALHHAIPAFITADSDFDTVQLPQGANLSIIKI